MPAHPRLRALVVTTAVALSLLAPLAPSSAAPASAPAAAPTAPAALGVPSRDVVGGLLVENSFVSSVGWVKPEETYRPGSCSATPVTRRCRGRRSW